MLTMELYLYVFIVMMPTGISNQTKNHGFVMPNITTIVLVFCRLKDKLISMSVYSIRPFARVHIYNPDFEDINSRLSSYASWNSENAPTPTILAEAGFYFTHIEDKVACHMCGHGLRN